MRLQSIGENATWSLPPDLKEPRALASQSVISRQGSQVGAEPVLSTRQRVPRQQNRNPGQESLQKGEGAREGREFASWKQLVYLPKKERKEEPLIQIADTGCTFKQHVGSGNHGFSEQHPRGESQCLLNS